MRHRLLARGPAPVAALHLPDLAARPSMTWLEDWAVGNAGVFARAGLPWVKLQDQTRVPGPASSEVVAVMASLARLIRAEHPGLGLGVIVEAHDPEASLSIAHAAGADFVRLKVFVGGAMTAWGPRHALAAGAVAHRARLGREDIAILADVHDRTSVPLSSEGQPEAAGWARRAGADGLVITGSDMEDTLSRIAAVRAEVPSLPVLAGGGVDAGNVGRVLAAAQGVIVSTSLMRRDAEEGDPIRWDGEACLRLVDAARAVRRDGAA
jgi:predicted TIM-barrel enzyme